MNGQLDALAQQLTANCGASGSALIQRAEDASLPQILWLEHSRAHALTGVADELIDGALSAIRESAVCIALGLVRPALGAMRVQIDLSLGWLYFRKHELEWNRVQTSGEGFKLKSDVIKYLEEHLPEFKFRSGLLKKRRTRQIEDPYRLLSAHIHAQSLNTLPVMIKPESIVGSVESQQQAIQMLSECSEYVSDLYWSCFGGQWYGLPEALRAPLESRLIAPQERSSFFNGHEPANA